MLEIHLPSKAARLVPADTMAQKERVSVTGCHHGVTQDELLKVAQKQIMITVSAMPSFIISHIVMIPCTMGRQPFN